MSFKNFVKSCLFYSGGYRLVGHWNRPHDNTLLILMYHQLTADQTPPTEWWNQGVHTQSQFAAHLKFLKKRFRLISVEDAREELETQGRWSAPSVAITFDDGYRSVYELGLPILQHFAVPATIYLPSAFIDRTQVPWWLELLEYLRQWDPATVPVSAIAKAMNIPSLQLDESGRDPTALRIRLHSTLRRHLRKMDDTRAKDAVGSLQSLVQGSATVDMDQWFMNWDEVREMMSAGIRFGAHTRTHCNLAQAEIGRARDEIIGSREDIEREIEEPVTGFAYPYGMDVEAYKRITGVLADAGFSYAVTAAPGRNTMNANPLLLRRITLPCATSRPLLAHVVYTIRA